MCDIGRIAMSVSGSTKSPVRSGEIMVESQCACVNCWIVLDAVLLWHFEINLTWNFKISLTYPTPIIHALGLHM